jgi:hypothetical protein
VLVVAQRRSYDRSSFIYCVSSSGRQLGRSVPAVPVTTGGRKRHGADVESRRPRSTWVVSATDRPVALSRSSWPGGDPEGPASVLRLWL